MTTSHATNALACCEWIRLLAGRSLALAQARTSDSGEQRWSYLVLGVPAVELLNLEDRAGLRLAQEAVRRDFAQLHRSIHELKELLKSRQSGNSAEAFLRSFDLIISLHLPTDPDCWIVTDEGLNIVQWGLRRERERRLLDWTREQLDAMQRHLLSQLGEIEEAPGKSPRTGSNTQIRQAMRERGASVTTGERGPIWREALAWTLVALLAMTTVGLIVRLAMMRSNPGQDPWPAELSPTNEPVSGGTSPSGAPVGSTKAARIPPEPDRPQDPQSSPQSPPRSDR